jgi:glycosyltransferase involved in cell wall biosynthesis
MQCLWLTLADPDPATNGQLIYSKGLIDSARDAGALLRVVGLRRVEKPMLAHHRQDVDWCLGEERHRLAIARLASPLPSIALRAASQELRRRLLATLGDRRWDAVVFDSICSGWALDIVQRHVGRCGRRPRLVYLAHNREEVAARRIAERADGLKRTWKQIDGWKVRRLEQRLVDAADLVTANTPEDAEAFAATTQGKPVLSLPPGYAGLRLDRRPFTRELPRRAILVGSLDWLAKRQAVERFLDAGAAMLAGAGVELQIVGEADPAYLAGLRRRHPMVDFVGRVEDVTPYMRQARVALVPDLLGGFKLKGLDYVFHRLPILAMRGALPGMPLEEGVSVGLFDDPAALARGIIEVIDDLAELEARQERAFAACVDRFDWGRIGSRLVEAIAAIRPDARRSVEARTMPLP